ncbi:MAG: PDDEXK nuclease domain-containing protein [Oscillospiraceae bacterium]|jgi:predicted nuclease of restriction endonuclease-like (RecB) superfamily|nr:PDDEXK nuclease domain-containing protein [Oscillospiraceae bacterium]
MKKVEKVIMQKNENKLSLNITDKPFTSEFFEKVAQIIEQSRRFAGYTVDLTMCAAYFEVGRIIVEEEQGGKARAEYGNKLLAGLSMFLNARVGKGYSESTLRNARKFYQVYSPSIQQTVFAESTNTKKNQIQQTLSAEFKNSNFANFKKMLSADDYPFKLSWSHYLILIRVHDIRARKFYEIEAIKQQWSFRQLQRQVGSSLFERLALSRDKDEILRLASEGLVIEKPQDMLKNPLVLEFLDLADSSSYSETDLETALINKLSKFLLELGKGFLFEARQKRFTFNEDHFKIDLIFYNRLLQCYVLFDLKINKLKHQDLGQMQMYVNYFDRFVKTEKENPTVGILLCEEKNDSIVELTLPEGANIYASEYSFYLPDKTLLQEKLAEWVDEFEVEQEMVGLQTVVDDNDVSEEETVDEQ